MLRTSLSDVYFCAKSRVCSTNVHIFLDFLSVQGTFGHGQECRKWGAHLIPPPLPRRRNHTPNSCPHPALLSATNQSGWLFCPAAKWPT